MEIFKVILHKNLDGGYTITVPALPGCITQGDTKEEALANAREAIILTLDDMAERGETPEDIEIVEVGSEERQQGPGHEPGARG